MAGISKINELGARKRALVNECESCRQALRAEVHNLQLYGASVKERLERIRSLSAWVLLAVPAIAPLLGLVSRPKTEEHRPSRLKGGMATALLGLRLYRKYSPMIRMFMARFRSKKQAASEARFPAANI